MEWTREKTKKIYKELERVFESEFESRNPSCLAVVVPSFLNKHKLRSRNYEPWLSWRPDWLDFLEQIGIYARFRPIRSSDWYKNELDRFDKIMRCFEHEVSYEAREKYAKGGVIVPDPSYVECMLVVPKETAEKILVLGL